MISKAQSTDMLFFNGFCVYRHPGFDRTTIRGQSEFEGRSRLFLITHRLFQRGLLFARLDQISRASAHVKRARAAADWYVFLNKRGFPLPEAVQIIHINRLHVLPCGGQAEIHCRLTFGVEKDLPVRFPRQRKKHRTAVTETGLPFPHHRHAVPNGCRQTA